MNRKIFILFLFIFINFFLIKIKADTSYLNKFSIAEKIEFLFMVGVNSSDINDVKNKWIQSKNFAGVFLLGNAFEDAATVNRFSQLINKNKKLPFLLAVDQEGGRVQRIKKGVMQLKAASEYGKLNSGLLNYKLGKSLGSDLRSIGIHISLGPVLDLDESSDTDIIGNRSYSPNFYVTTKSAVSFALGLNDSNITTCVKHFPNHGFTDVDSHTKLPVVHQNLKQINSKIIPYKYYIKYGLPMIMVGHIKYPQIDSVHPASLSKKIISLYLKDTLKFKGIVITDDLNMKAITNNYSIQEACYLALKAGSDMLLINQSPKDIDSCVKYIYQKIIKGDLSESEIDNKVLKVLNLKTRYLDEK